MINVSKFIQRTYELEEEQRQKSAAKPKRELPVLQIHLNCTNGNINSCAQPTSDTNTVSDLILKADPAVQGYVIQQQGMGQQQQQQFTFRNATVVSVQPQNENILDATASSLQATQLSSSSPSTGRTILADDSIIRMNTTKTNGIIAKAMSNNNNSNNDTATKIERQQQQQQNGAITTVNWSNIMNQQQYQQYSSSSSQPELDHHNRKQSAMYSQPQVSHQLMNDDKHAHQNAIDDDENEDGMFILQKDPSKNQPYTYSKPSLQQQYEGCHLNTQQLQECNHPNYLSEIAHYPTHIIPLDQSNKASLHVSSSTQLEYSALKPFQNMNQLQQQRITEQCDKTQSTVDTMRQKNRSSEHLMGESMKQQDLINSYNNNQQNNSLCWKQLSHDTNNNRNICSNCSSSIESTIKEQQDNPISLNLYQQSISRSDQGEAVATGAVYNSNNLGNTRYQTCDDADADEEHDNDQLHSQHHEEEQEYLPRFSQCEGNNAGLIEQSKTMSSQSLHTLDQQHQYQQQYGYILQQERDSSSSPKSPMQTNLNQQSLRSNLNINNTPFDHYQYNNNNNIDCSAYSQSSQQHQPFPFVNPFSTGIIDSSYNQQQQQCIPQSSIGNTITNSNNSNFAYYNDSPTFSKLSNYQTPMVVAVGGGVITGQQIQEQQQLQKKKDSLTISQSNSSLQYSRQKSYEEAFRNVLAIDPRNYYDSADSKHADDQRQFTQNVNDHRHQQSQQLQQQQQHRNMNSYGEQQLTESYQYSNGINANISRSRSNITAESTKQHMSGQSGSSFLIDSSAIISYNNYLQAANTSTKQQQILTQTESKAEGEGEEQAERQEYNPNIVSDSLHKEYLYSSELQQLPMGKQSSKDSHAKNQRNQAYVVSMSIASTADQSTSRLKLDTLTRLLSPEEEQEEIARMQQQQQLQQDQSCLKNSRRMTGEHITNRNGDVETNNSSNCSSRITVSRNTRQQQLSLPAMDTLLIRTKQNTQVLQHQHQQLQHSVRSRERKISITIQDLVTPNSKLTTPNNISRKKPQENDDTFQSPGTPQLFRRFRSPSTVEATSRSKKEDQNRNDLSPSPFKNSASSKVVYSFSRLKTAGTPSNRSLNTTPKNNNSSNNNNKHIRRNSNLDTQDSNTMIITHEELLLGSSYRRSISPLQAKNTKTLWNGNLPQTVKTPRTSSSLNKYTSSTARTISSLNRKSQERTQENHNSSAFNVSNITPAERLSTNSKHGNIPPLPVQKFYKSSAAKPATTIGDDKMKRCIEQLYTSEALGQNSERKQQRQSSLSAQQNHNQHSARSSQSSRMQLFKCNHGVMQIYCSQCSRKSRSMISNQLNAQINQIG